MLSVNGNIELRVNGAVAAKFSNLLLEDFYATPFSNNPQCFVSESATPPTISEVEANFPALATSDVGLDFTQGTTSADANYLYASYSTDLYFPSNFSGTIASIGLILGSRRVSRALVRDVFGAVSTIPVTLEDTVSVRYTLTYKIARAPRPVTLQYQGQALSGTLRSVNPNQWGGADINPAAELTHLIVPTNNVTVGADGYLPAGETVYFSSEVVQSTTEHSSTSRGDAFSFTVPQGAAVGKEFDQMLFAVGAGVSNAVLLLEIEEPIVKTVDDTLTISLVIDIEA